MKKRLISAILAFAMLFTFAEAVIASDGCTQCGKRADADVDRIIFNIIQDELKPLKPDDVYNQAKACLDTMTESGTWDDIDYKQQAGTTWPASAQIDRLRIMARAYAKPNQPLYQSEDILKAIEKGLPIVESKLLRMNGTERACPGNWWWYNLYSPFRLSITLLIVRGKIDENVFNTSLETVL